MTFGQDGADMSLLRQGNSRKTKGRRTMVEPLERRSEVPLVDVPPAY